MTRRWIALAAVMLTAVVLVAGCGTFRATTRTRNELHRAGFSAAGVSANERNGFSTVTVRVRQLRGPGDFDEIANVVWRTFDYRIDEVDIEEPRGNARFSRSDLIERFGPRPASFDDRTIGSDAKRTVRTVGIIGAIVAVLFLVVVGIGVALLVWYLHRRQQRPPPSGPAPPFNPPVSGIGGTGWIPPQGGSGGGSQWPPPPR